jgi:hypothetical protein
MRNFIITEGQLSHLLEVIQTGAYNVTIVGKSFRENNNYYYVNEPKIVEGGSNKLPLNDLSKLKDPGGILNIKVGDIEFNIDLSKWECSNVEITTFGNLQIPKKCYDLKGSDVPVNDKKVITPPISKVDFYKPEKSNNVFYYTKTNLKTYKGKELRFFNGILRFKLEFDNLPDDSTIIFQDMYNSDNEYKYNKNEIKISTNGTPFVSAPDDGFSKQDINDALKMAFNGTDYWIPAEGDFSAGLRGIHTIGERDGTSESWSIMNYFDTKNEVKELIKQKWEKEGDGDKIEWLSNIFKTNDDFLKNLLDIQWKSIKSGTKTESDTINNVKDYFNEKGINVEFETYPPGHILDRGSGIDFTIILGGKRFTVQVKPLKSKEISDNKTIIKTYKMSNWYKSKKEELDFIVYNNGPNFLVFKNSNYEVSEDGKTVTHYVKPIEISDIK